MSDFDNYNPEPYCLIKLTKGFETKVSVDDYKYLRNFKWYSQINPSGKVYAVRRPNLSNGQKVTCHMHREILEKHGYDLTGLVVDHISFDSLDNRISNLRPATKSQNGQNRGLQVNSKSKLKGVHWDKEKNKWCAKISLFIDGKRVTKFLGRSHDKIDAAKMYNEAALKYFGEYAVLNEIP